LNSEDDNATLE